mmetsp:Transcript_63686/g.175818  ORF Transcript_63686/g.175818 Transcript_63686/m.175818 type:complete len:364 (-) Transcript_63686:221-1312(-)
MPIITPSYPEMNSSYNVGEPQLRSLREEIARGVELTFAIEQGKAVWSELFIGHNFFAQYQHYIQVDVSAHDAAAHRAWFGWCESRLRQLVLCLDQPPSVQAHPHAEFFEWTATRGSKERRPRSAVAATPEGGGVIGTSFYVALSFAPGVRQADLTASISDWVYRMNMWDRRQPGMDLSINHVRAKNLPAYCVGAGSRKKMKGGGARVPEAKAVRLKAAARSLTPPPLRERTPKDTNAGEEAATPTTKAPTPPPPPVAVAATIMAANPIAPPLSPPRNAASSQPGPVPVKATATAAEAPALSLGTTAPTSGAGVPTEPAPNEKPGSRPRSWADIAAGSAAAAAALKAQESPLKRSRIRSSSDSD